MEKDNSRSTPAPTKHRAERGRTQRGLTCTNCRTRKVCVGMQGLIEGPAVLLSAYTE